MPKGEDYSRSLPVQFDTVEQAIDCYHAGEYQKARDFRIDAAVRPVCIVEGI